MQCFEQSSHREIIRNEIWLVLPPPKTPVDCDPDAAKRRRDTTNPPVRLINKTEPRLNDEVRCTVPLAAQAHTVRTQAESVLAVNGNGNGSEHTNGSRSKARI